MSESPQNNTKGRGQRIYIATLFSNALVLLILGLIIFFGLYARNLSIKVREDLPLLVIMNENAKDSSIIQLQNQINKKDFAKKTVLVSKDSAAKSLRSDLKNEDFVRFLGYNPLSASIEIYLKYQYVNLDSISPIKTFLLKNPTVDEISYQGPQIESISKNIRTLTLILILFLVINLGVAISLIYVTTRLSIYSQRFQIKTMQLFGATKTFIQGPFLKSAAIVGLLAGILAPIILQGLLYLVEKDFPELTQLRTESEVILIFFILLITGIILSFLSTFFAVNRYLRRKIDELY